MSSTNAEEEASQMSEGTNILNFMKNLLKITLTILIVIILGSFVVFSCKVAQSNVLPTDINCFPYTSAIPTVQQISININDHFLEGKNLSQKIKFPYEQNSSNFIQDFLRRLRLNPNGFGLENYFIAILDGMFAFNYSAFNTLFDGLNYLPEIIVLLIGPIITIIFCSILSLVDLFYIGYLWFTNFSWFFQENENKSGTGAPSWKPITLAQPLNYCLSIFLMFIFFIIFIIGLFTFLPIVATTIILICLFTILSRTGLTSNNDKYTLLSCMKDSLKYNKKGIMIILSISILSLSFNYFGSVLGGICLVCILLLYFNVIPLSIFTSSIPTDLSAVVSDKKASKKCNFEETPTPNTNPDTSKHTTPDTSKHTTPHTSTGEKSSENNTSIMQKIGGFLPKFPSIFPSVNVVETYDTPIPEIPYPAVSIDKLKLPNVKLPEEVEIKFPDIKLPGLPQVPDVPEPVSNAIINAQDNAIENLNEINKSLKSD
jgi:hypothetical protein